MIEGCEGGEFSVVSVLLRFIVGIVVVAACLEGGGEVIVEGRL